MSLIEPLNDKECLRLMHAEVMRLLERPAVRAMAAEFATTEDLAEYIRQLTQRWDYGDPDDGPRLPCEVSQRSRFAPLDPNCFERSSMYLSVAEIIDPTTVRTSASMSLSGGWHTFPVELRDGVPHVVVLDPYSAPEWIAPRNASLVTAYEGLCQGPDASLSLRDPLVQPRWYFDVARNVCSDALAEPLFEHVFGGLRNGLLTGVPVAQMEAVDWLLAETTRDAQMWPEGRDVIQGITRSIRNFAVKLDLGQVSGFLESLAKSGKSIAPKAVRAALVAEYGPAAALLLDGLSVALEGRAPGNAEKRLAQGPRDGRDDGGRDDGGRDAADVAVSARLAMRRMTFAFRAV